MSRFLSGRYKGLIPYTPGEQPQNRKYIKLNTNESPFPPSERSVRYAQEAASRLELYPDPECRELREKTAEILGVAEDEVILTNGSDEVLNFAFMAFCDENISAVFPDITYGFYSVFAELNRISYSEIPLKADLSIDFRDYCNVGKTVFIANPNAPTGLALKLWEIEEILKSNPKNVVVIDEAYVDFGGESCVPLIRKYENLLVTQTFSKSRSMAGARLGFGVGNTELIRDLNTIRNSTNPYNINRMTMAAGLGALEDNEYTKKNCSEIIRVRKNTKAALCKLGFEMTDSETNFIFAKHPVLDGADLYLRLKEKGILVRHFEKDRISQYNRITIGTEAQMQGLIETVKDILEEG